MYRSSGTASSPDLATLLRKSKAKESATAAKDSRPAKTAHLPELVPNRLRTAEASSPNSRERQRFSTSSSATSQTTPSPHVTPASKGKTKASGLLSPGARSPDWVLTSPRSMSSMRVGDSGVSKSSKSSVRAKTTAFLGKMLGTSTTRERSRTFTSAPYSAPPLFEAFPPPVPPLPKAHRQAYNTDDPDIFTSPSSSFDVQKPLPAIQRKDSYPDIEDTDEQSMVVIQQRARTPSPTATVTHDSSKTATITASRNKRRSMSVSDVDLKRVMTAVSSVTPLPSSGEETGWDTALNGILGDFKGELLQLDPVSTSLDLRDPSTPPRRPSSSGRSQSDMVVTSSDRRRPEPRSSASMPLTAMTPSVTIQPAATEENEPSVHSPRTSLHTTPIRTRSGSGASSVAPSPRVSGLRHGPRSPNRAAVTSLTYIPSPTRDANRLRVQHRSSASSSEPSLIPIRDEGRIFAGLSAVSQQDLTHNDLTLRRFASNRSPAKGEEETGDITNRGKDLAARCWAEDEEFLAKDKIAEWLGGLGLINKVALRHYIDFFDFTGLRLDNAFRRLCAKLYLKAETQQVDRILEEFARRFWEGNPTSIFGNASVVHAVTYSLLLLNTDLHVAELTSRMSRGQFVRNTLAAIQTQLQPGSTSDLTYDDWSSVRGGSDISDSAPNGGRTIKRSDSITSWSSVTREAIVSGLGTKAPSSGQLTTASTETSTNTSVQTPVNESAISVGSMHQEMREAKTSDNGSSPVVYDRNWENEMESMLKEIYSAVKSQQILQPIGSILMARSSTSSLSPHGTMLRNRSLRGQQQDRLTTLKRGSIRGLQSILSSQGGFSPYGNSNNLDGRASPAPSFATSDGVHASNVSFLTPTLGFASNLSHTIIREAQEDDSHSLRSDHSISTELSITDEELALLGPPWAKEGMLCRKQYWESTGKRAKSKAWMDVFVVIQKGELSMFVFGDHSLGSAAVVGGGNWLENANPVGTVLLAHSLAHALPPPGYNRQRPHCMVLTLANGGVYFFQAGTEELVNEWVSTCNYWAARQSKEPLAGGVSNMEYGWNRVLDPVTRARSISEDNFTHDTSDNVSVRSGRSGKSRFSKKDFATVRADKSPWGDRIFINDWKPPMPPSVPSNQDEEGQLEALQKHVTSLKLDLTQHNELRTPMNHLYTPRSTNAAKSMSNWEKRSQYILTEIVKYESYIDSLQAATSLRLKKRGEKALERALGGGPEEDQAASTKGKWKGQPDAETIEEGEEPPPSAMLDPSPSRTQFHRRELAEGEPECD